MQIASKIKKTIATLSLLALSGSAWAALPITTPGQALDWLTGENQPSDALKKEICVSVTPYFLASAAPDSAPHFFSLQIDGVTPTSNTAGQCNEPGPTGKCQRGFIKISSTAPIACHVPGAR